jgi:hypothetical protein
LDEIAAGGVERADIHCKLGFFDLIEKRFWSNISSIRPHLINKEEEVFAR